MNDRLKHHPNLFLCNYAKSKENTKPKSRQIDAIVLETDTKSERKDSLFFMQAYYDAFSENQPQV